MNYIIIILTIIFSSGSNKVQETADTCYQRMLSRELYNIIGDNKLVIIDVRSLQEYEKGRIENAFLASNSKLLNLICQEFEKTHTIIIYCEKGDRSGTAAQIICSKYNFKNVYNLKGGILEWEKTGYSVDKSKINYDN